jgi:hypothetical protein
MADPYELLREARSLIQRYSDDPAHYEWLKDYDKLPGAKLKKTALKVLKHPSLRCKHNQLIVEHLLKEGYLKKVQMMRGSPGHARSYTVVRRSEKGRLALLLRGHEIKECC